MVDGSRRISSREGLEHPFFTHERGTRTLEVTKQIGMVLENQDKMMGNLESIEERMELMRGNVDRMLMEVRSKMMNGELNEEEENVFFRIKSQTIQGEVSEQEMGEYEDELRRILEGGDEEKK